MNEELRNLGYSDNDYHKIRSVYYLRDSSDNRCIKLLLEKHNYFLELGYSNKEVHKMILSNPLIVSYSLDDLKKRKEFLSYGIDEARVKKMIYHFPLVITTKEENVNKKIINFLDLGYKWEDIAKMIGSNPQILAQSLDSIRLKVNNLLEKGFTLEKIIRMTVKAPAIYTQSPETINDKIDNFLELGFSIDEINKIVSLLPAILTHSKEIIRKQYNLVNEISVGYAVRTLVKAPGILTMSDDNLRSKQLAFMGLGYSKEQISRIMYLSPTLFVLERNSYVNKFMHFLKQGLSEQEIIEATVKNPCIYTYSMESLEAKSKVFRDFGIPKVYAKKPSSYMQSKELTFARCMFLKDIKYEFNENKLSALFDSNNNFLKKFDISKEELLKNYSMEEYYGTFKNI